MLRVLSYDLLYLITPEDSQSEIKYVEHILLKGFWIISRIWTLSVAFTTEPTLRNLSVSLAWEFRNKLLDKLLTLFICLFLKFSFHSLQHFFLTFSSPKPFHKPLCSHSNSWPLSSLLLHAHMYLYIPMYF